MVISAVAASAVVLAARPQVMVVGTYHMANPQLDLVKVEIRDTMSEARQKELLQIVDEIARFRPTLICVEELPESSDVADRLAGYRNGTYTLTANESDQIGLRLGKRFPAMRMAAIDYRNEFPIEPVFLAATDAQREAFLGVSDLIEQRSVEVDRRFSVSQILAMLNDPAYQSWGHSMYLNTIRMGDGAAGSRLMAAWSERNWRMTANTLRAIRSGEERVIVIVGASHAYPIATALRESMGIDVVSPLTVLPKPEEPWVTPNLREAAQRLWSFEPSR